MAGNSGNMLKKNGAIVRFYEISISKICALSLELII